MSNKQGGGMSSVFVRSYVLSYFIEKNCFAMVTANGKR